MSKVKKGTHTTKTSAWTNTVRNRMRQKAGEIEGSRALEIGYWKTEIGGKTSQKVSKGRREQGQDWGMAEENISKIHGPKENAPSNNTQLSIQRMEKHNHQRKRVRKM